MADHILFQPGEGRISVPEVFVGIRWSATIPFLFLVRDDGQYELDLVLRDSQTSQSIRVAFVTYMRMQHQKRKYLA